MSDSASLATADQLPPSGTDSPELPDPPRSKLPPDDPRLKLPRARPRTLKKGPAIALATAVAGLAGIAVILALNPHGATAAKDHAAEQEQPSLAQTFPIPDAIKNAPDNSSPLATALAPSSPTVPRLGEPLPGQDAPPSAASPQHGLSGGMPGPEEQRR